MKNRIEVENREHGKLSFFLKNKTGRYYLYKTGYNEGVYRYFSPGRSEAEVRSFSYYGKNRKLRYVMSYLPKCIDYVMKYEVEQ